MSVEKYYKEANRAYSEGRVVDAFNLYLDLAKDGHAECQAFVGWMFMSGVGTTRNEDEAERWLLSGCAQGDIEALLLLGDFYERRGELGRAAETYEAASSKGHQTASYRLAMFNLRNHKVVFDKKSILQFLTLAAEQGHIYAKATAGKMMITGKLPGGILSGVINIIEAFRMGFRLIVSSKEENPFVDPRLRK